MISFGSDTTLRWACRAGDYVLWAKFQGMFSREGEEYQIADLWELRDGNFVTITNRYQDLPEGFDLHPFEVTGSCVRWMRRRLNEGYEPQEPIDGQNLWRVFAGDKLLWVGNRRGAEHSSDGVLGLLEFRTNALIYGEPFDFSGEYPIFGGFESDKISTEGTKLCHAGWTSLISLGLPCNANADGQWRLG